MPESTCGGTGRPREALANRCSLLSSRKLIGTIMPEIDSPAAPARFRVAHFAGRPVSVDRGGRAGDGAVGDQSPVVANAEALLDQTESELATMRPLAVEEVARQFEASTTLGPIKTKVRDVRYSPKEDAYRGSSPGSIRSPSRSGSATYSSTRRLRRILRRDSQHRVHQAAGEYQRLYRDRQGAIGFQKNNTIG